ncbi:MAG: L,D-transpeptidase [Chitinophagaceae bacterium]
MKKIILSFLVLLFGYIGLAQNRQADSLRVKQYLHNKHIADSLKKKKELDAYLKYKQNHPDVVTYNSKGERVEKSVARDGTITTTRIIRTAPVLNRPINPDTIDKQLIELRVYKSKYRMNIMYKGKVLTAYKCVFGANPKGQKLQEGDRHTPEGTFTILDNRLHDKWEVFMLLDYPTVESRNIHLDAKSRGLISPDARIGGNVGIHGIWNGGDNVIDLKHNWTDGCVGLKNADVIELSKLIMPGVTKITIYP